MKSFSEECGVDLRINSLKTKEETSKNNAMSTKTKDFIQKICYRKTASIDMTQYGFINDSKLSPLNNVIKLLRAQLEKIRVKPLKESHNLPPALHQRLAPKVASSTRWKQHYTSKSALSCPRNSLRDLVRKVRILRDANPSHVAKKVRIVVSGKEGKKKDVLDHEILI